MDSVANRIRQGMELRGLKQVDIIERTGINKGALSSYLSGRYEPKQNNIYLIARALNVSEAWLMGYDVPMDRIPAGKIKGIRIPVLGTVHAGVPIAAVEDVLGYEEITPQLAVTGEFFGLIVHSLPPFSWAFFVGVFIKNGRFRCKY